MSAPVPELEHRPLTPPQELLANTAFLLARIGTAIKARSLEEFDQESCSMYQYGVLALLGEGDCETQAGVARRLGLDSSQLVGVLDELEGRGFVERRRDPNDRRRHTVSLTAEGKRELVRLRAIARRIEESVLQPLDESSRRALHESLAQVAAGFDWHTKRA